MTQEDKKLLRIEKDIYDLIPRFKGMHGNYIADRSYESIRLLAHAAKQLMMDCVQIMKTYNSEEVHTDIQQLLGY